MDIFIPQDHKNDPIIVALISARATMISSCNLTPHVWRTRDAECRDAVALRIRELAARQLREHSPDRSYQPPRYLSALQMALAVEGALPGSVLSALRLLPGDRSRV